MPTYDPKDIAQALVQARGIKAHAARLLGCSRTTIHRYCTEDDEVRAAYEDANESMKDVAENRLYDLINNPDHRDHFRALRFYLRTKGRDRGYGTGRDDAVPEELPPLGITIICDGTVVEEL